MINLPDLTQNLSYGLLLMIGLITGLHCVTMCGGFVVSYTANDAKEGRNSYLSHLKYGGGKTLSYTIIGALFGFVGSIIAFTPMMRGTVGIMAGIFLIIYGLKMLNVIPSLRKFGIKVPKSILKFTSKSSKKNSSSPFIIGLLNGLMIACGPLQAMYILAAGKGSAIEGAKILFLFGIGTLPVLLSFGYITSVLSKAFTRKILKGSAVIVMILGVIMLNEGLSLTGSGYDFNTIKTSFAANSLGSGEVIESNENLGVAVVKDGYQEIRMEVNRYGWSPDTFVIQKDIPVKWIIDGKEINGCNNAIQVPKYNLEFDIKSGEQIIEFTPTQTGSVAWSCWMGMIPGTFIVKDEVNAAVVKKELNILATTPKAPAPSCGASGGGCGCGG